MIVYDEPRDILRATEQTIVNPVNTQGVAGSGLALAVRNRFPGWFAAYRKACRQGVFESRGLFVFDVDETFKILSFPTKHAWREDSKLEWIKEGLIHLVRDYKEYGITSLAMPEIGCGRGHLEWSDVAPLVYHYLDPIDLEVGICRTPYDGPMLMTR